MMGRQLSAESIAKGAAKRQGFRHDPDAKAKMSVAHIGRIVSAETRAKKSAAQMGRKMSAEAIEKSRQWRLGRTYGAKAKAAMGAAQSKRYQRNYVFCSPMGDIVRTQNIKPFAEMYGLKASNVSALIHGIAKTLRGWSFVGFED